MFISVLYSLHNGSPSIGEHSIRIFLHFFFLNRLAIARFRKSHGTCLIRKTDETRKIPTSPSKKRNEIHRSPENIQNDMASTFKLRFVLQDFVYGWCACISMVVLKCYDAASIAKYTHTLSHKYRLWIKCGRLCAYDAFVFRCMCHTYGIAHFQHFVCFFLRVSSELQQQQKTQTECKRRQQRYTHWDTV